MSHATVASAKTGSLATSLLKYCIMAAIPAAILGFVSGHLQWWRAWWFVGLTAASQVMTVFFVRRVNPGLLEERSRIRKGTKSWDKVLVPLVGAVGPLAIWCAAAWDVRFHWPPAVSIEWTAAAFAVSALAAVVMAWAMVTNRFFSATVRIQEERGHHVIDSGPYRYVRHPGYSGAIAFTLASPIALGSWVALVPAACTVVALVVRTVLEDRTLRAELAGYEDYTRKVRNRLVPGIW